MFGGTLLKFSYLLGAFQKLTYQQLATPQLIRKMLRRPIPGLDRKANFGIYQGKRHRTKVQSCFSEVKSNKLILPNIFYKVFYCSILDRRIKIHVSAHALRTIKKQGGLDNYLCCMDSNRLDPYAQYLQAIIFMKLRNPDMIIPPILKSAPLKKIREKEYTYRKTPRVIMPKNPDPYHNPRPFGHSHPLVQQLLTKEQMGRGQSNKKARNKIDQQGLAKLKEVEGDVEEK